MPKGPSPDLPRKRQLEKWHSKHCYGLEKDALRGDRERLAVVNARGLCTLSTTYEAQFHGDGPRI
jgi:hypothetical protein